MPSPSAATGNPDPKRLHVLVANIPAFGHVTPLLELAKKIGKFHSVTFALSSFMASELVKKELIRETDPMDLYRIKDDIVDIVKNEDLEDGLGSFFELFLPAMGDLFRSMPTKNEPKRSETMKPVDVVIGDMFVGREFPICKERGVPFYIFNAENAMQTNYFFSIDEDFPTVPDIEANVFYKVMGPGIPRQPIGKNWKAIALPVARFLSLSSGIIINSFREAEVETIRNIEGIPGASKIPIFCLGPLLPEETHATTTSATHHQSIGAKVATWLNRQPTNSVVYVSFGSIATLSAPQMDALGTALLRTGRPFIWSLREKDYGILPGELIKNVLGQFEDPGSKHLVLNWAPQKLILQHPSVAAFISHCGWNSTLESVSYGKPIIAWPLFADQLLNAQWIVRLGAAALIPDTNINCSRIVSVAEIEETLEKVVGWTTHVESSYTKEAKTWGKKIGATWSSSDEGSCHAEFLDLIKFQSN